MGDNNIKHRPIRSFVLRTGRLTTGQQKAFTEFWPKFGIGFDPGREIDFYQQFGNDRPVYLEIGFGNGESLATMAKAHPEHNYLGIEVHTPGVGHLLIRLNELQLDNVRIIQHDAVEVLQRMIMDASLTGVQLFFPDPWHKKRHHKRRIVQPGFVELLTKKIRPGGLFHAATDWENYAEHMLEVLNGFPGQFENTADSSEFLPRPDNRPLTKFEQRGHRLGHGVWDLVFRRLKD